MGQHERPPPSHMGKPGADRRVGAPVIDQHEPAALRQGSLDRAQAEIELGKPGINRDDHVTRRPAPLDRRPNAFGAGTRQKTRGKRAERIRLSCRRIGAGEMARSRSGSRAFRPRKQRAAPEMPPSGIHNPDRARRAGEFGGQGELPAGPLVLSGLRRKRAQRDRFGTVQAPYIDSRSRILVCGTPRPTADPARGVRCGEPVHRREPCRAQPAAEQGPPIAGRGQALRPLPSFGQGAHPLLPRTQLDATGGPAIQAEPYGPGG